MFDTDDIEAEDYKGFRIRLVYDTDPMDPRGWDNLGTMVCAHRDYILGDVQLHPWRFDDGDILGFAPVEDECAYEHVVPEGSVILPLYLIDHSGLAMRTRSFADVDPGEWDSGQVGIIYADPNAIRKGMMVKRVTEKTREKVRDVLRSEVEVYSHYLEGAVCGYIVEGPTGQHEDSCFGFYGWDGIDDARQQARDYIDWKTSREIVGVL